jgi:PAS domain-containing protein
MTLTVGDLASDRVQLETMIAGISIGVITVDTDGTLQYANRAALAMHGVDDLASLGHTTKAYREQYAVQDLQGIPLPPAPSRSTVCSQATVLTSCWFSS